MTATISTSDGAYLDEIGSAVQTPHHHSGEYCKGTRGNNRLSKNSRAFPGNDEAYKAVAYLYEAIKEDELLRQWILQRAEDASMPNDKRAEAFIVVASKEWDCSFKITELPAIKTTTVQGNRTSVRYQMPKERLEFERAKECATRGLEMVNAAITLTPESEQAWAYKTNILLELAKLAEMSGEVQHRRELLRQYEEALNETTKFAKRSQSKP